MKSEEFIREVDEELQRDRLNTLWRRYGRVVIAAAVLLVVGVAAQQAWLAWQASQQAKVATQYAEIDGQMREGTFADAAREFDALAANAPAGFVELARLREAAAADALKDPAARAAALDKLASDPKADPLLRDLAVLLAVSGELDSGDPATLQGRLAPLAAAGQPWRNSAREMQALLYIRTGETEKARPILDELTKDAAATPAQQQRVAAILQSLGGAGS
ncbi:MAG: tetratricopeptide repeat protein [Geminicoccaceae bacterium]